MTVEVFDCVSVIVKNIRRDRRNSKPRIHPCLLIRLANVRLQPRRLLITPAVRRLQAVLGRSNVIALAEPHHDFAQAIVEDFQRRPGNVGWHAAIVCFGDTAGDAGERVGISTQ